MTVGRALSSVWFFAVLVLALAVHDSMNFVLKAGVRECFYEDFDANSPVRTIDAFVQAGGNVAVLLTIHGPLELADIRSVSCARALSSPPLPAPSLTSPRTSSGQLRGPAGLGIGRRGEGVGERDTVVHDGLQTQVPGHVRHLPRQPEL